MNEQNIILGYAPMDDVHDGFHTVIRGATQCADEDFPDRLDEVVRHLRSHFLLEDQWMNDTKFPPGDCHRDEHAAVLRSADEVQALQGARLIAIGRDFVRELNAWFPGHANHLDSALAAWMCKRSLGGKPVVVHRRPRGAP